MIPNQRFRRIALALIGVVTLAFAVGCGSDEPPAEAEAKKVITDMQRQTMQQMNEAAEEAYQSVQSGDLERTKAKIAQLSVLSTKLSYEGLATVDGIQAITETITSAMRSLNAVSPDPMQVSMRVASVRLTVDALAHRQHPMWLDYRNPLTGDLERMAAAIEAQNDPEASVALGLWRGHISIVRPAIVVSRDAAEAVKLDSITAFLENSVRTADWPGLKQAMPNLEDALGEVFREEDQETISPLWPTAEPPHPIIWSLSLGSFIVGVLTYVAWRRYTAEQGITRVKKARDFDADP